MTKVYLETGDTLIYRPGGFMGFLVALKTWNRYASHVEVYIGGSQSYASRPGFKRGESGVGVWKLNTERISYVLRPLVHVSMRDALKWAYTTTGQKYDWKGLLVFTLAVAQGAKDRMFCSEAWTRFYRSGGLEPFSVNYSGVKTVDADTVAPTTCTLSARFEVVTGPINTGGEDVKLHYDVTTDRYYFYRKD